MRGGRGDWSWKKTKGGKIGREGGFFLDNRVLNWVRGERGEGSAVGWFEERDLSGK